MAHLRGQKTREFQPLSALCAQRGQPQGWRPRHVPPNSCEVFLGPSRLCPSRGGPAGQGCAPRRATPPCLLNGLSSKTQGSVYPAEDSRRGSPQGHPVITGCAQELPGGFENLNTWTPRPELTAPGHQKSLKSLPGDFSVQSPKVTFPMLNTENVPSLPSFPQTCPSLLLGFPSRPSQEALRCSLAVHREASARVTRPFIPSPLLPTLHPTRFTEACSPIRGTPRLLQEHLCTKDVAFKAQEGGCGPSLLWAEGGSLKGQELPRGRNARWRSQSSNLSMPARAGCAGLKPRTENTCPPVKPLY